MSLPRSLRGRLPFFVSSFFAAVAIGCGARSLDPNEPVGTGGTGGHSTPGGSTGSDARPGLPPIPVVPTSVDCGNGILDPGEQCDDGNRSSGDGCTALCQIPCNWICGSCGTPTPCITTVVCGDGVLASFESCDDGNTMSGDGCAASCMAIEIGWRCPVPGRRCFPICGDGLIVGTEPATTATRCRATAAPPSAWSSPTQPVAAIG